MDRYVYEDKTLYIVFDVNERITEIKGDFPGLYNKILGKNYIYLSFPRLEFNSEKEKEEFNKILKISETVYKDTEEYKSSKKKLENVQEGIKFYKDLTDGIYIFVDPENDECINKVPNYSKRTKISLSFLKKETVNKKLNPFRIIISEELVNDINFNSCGEAVKIESGKNN